MQTFLPLTDFAACARVLDSKRLGKQRVECLQILQCLTGTPSRWLNHPAVQMWKGYEAYLALYGVSICKEWLSRGYKDTCLSKINALLPTAHNQNGCERPPWFGGPIHDSHKAALLRKLPEWYSQFHWNVDPEMPYYWPTKETS